ncbi:MAG: 30S ribosomal protein S5 [Pseudomonadota bacterium]|nr:30S ribosomal protein S5 [Pseudomonadota bacterium]
MDKDVKNIDANELTEKLVSINRVAKVVKGGRRFGFAALVVVGDTRGRVGFGTGKAKEVPEAIKKATEKAKIKMLRIPLKEGRTIHHDIKGRHGASKVILRTAPPGTGIIAGGPMRAVFETLGVQDVVSKSVGSSSPYNMVRATFEGLKNIQSPRNIASRRGLKVSDIFGKKNKKKNEETKKEEPASKQKDKKLNE